MTTPESPEFDDLAPLDSGGTLYVNVYLEDRHYGGPEEGGWWYDAGVVVSSVQCNTRDMAQKLIGLVKEFCDVENSQRNSDTSQSNSEGRFLWTVEESSAQPYPQRRPHYE